MSKALRTDRRELVEQQRTLVRSADADSRAMNDSELSTFDKLNDEINRLKRSIDAHDAVHEAERREAEAAPVVETRTPATLAQVEVTTPQGVSDDEHRAAFGRLLRTGSQAALRGRPGN